jgi:hypothetical protein
MTDNNKINDNMENKTGRPKKYKTEEERKEVRTIQNRINQINCRKRKKLLKIKKNGENISTKP